MFLHQIYTKIILFLAITFARKSITIWRCDLIKLPPIIHVFEKTHWSRLNNLVISIDNERKERVTLRRLREFNKSFVIIISDTLIDTTLQEEDMN